jgi:hypothetical protein
MDLLTSVAVGEIIGRPYGTVYLWAKRGLLPHKVASNGLVLFTWKDVERARQLAATMPRQGRPKGKRTKLTELRGK